MQKLSEHFSLFFFSKKLTNQIIRCRKEWMTCSYYSFHAILIHLSEKIAAETFFKVLIRMFDNKCNVYPSVWYILYVIDFPLNRHYFFVKSVAVESFFSSVLSETFIPYKLIIVARLLLRENKISKTISVAI